MTSGGYAGLAVLCLVLAMALMGDAAWWRWLEYSAAGLGGMAVYKGWREWAR